MAKPPIQWYGGKQRLAPLIAALLPPHRTYIEPFAGSAAVLFAKDPSPVEVLNDLDSDLVNMWLALRDEAVPLLLHLAFAPRARTYLAGDPPEDPVERAAWLIVGQQLRAAADPTARVVPLRFYDGVVRRTTDVEKLLPRIMEAHKRIRDVIIENRDALVLLEKADHPTTLAYVDPPYPFETRQTRKHSYKHEDTGDLWPRLIEWCLNARSHVVVSSYQSEYTERLVAGGWRQLEIDVALHSAGKRGARATELLLFAPRTAEALGDQLNEAGRLVATVGPTKAGRLLTDEQGDSDDQ